ncbi:hypothetical protein [Brevibacillus fulvus]|uniref:Uncharacterized protein n=1 Tax=Brevibacillus fulvus TaxID=1125967 RepID=A0A938XZG4_9BACL|nr:hypothetical protein [Brevibacillus fulvus]MBM7590428.1 hypothetical protein [Brevibacillus fulvus]
MLTQQQPLQQQVRFSTQAFLILCRLFDGCYDELKENHSLQERVESIAASLLSGVTALQEQTRAPQEVVLTLSFADCYFLRKLLHEVLPRAAEDGKLAVWIEECIRALEQTGGADEQTNA